VNIYVEALERLGIAPSVSSVDPAQYRERTDAFDFDMTTYRRGLSLSPATSSGSTGAATWSRPRARAT
jgi:peptide/nickel transport system substrate-binding protein